MSDALKKFFGSRDDVPDWARFFGTAAYRNFMSAVESILTVRGWKYEIGDGVIRLQPPGRAPMMCGLANLAQVCNQLPDERWPSVIGSHFEAFLSDEPVSLDAYAADFERAKAHLKVRLYPSHYSEAVPPSALVARRPADEILEVLVYDLPHTVATVHPDHVKRWEVPPERLFDIGRDNVRGEGRLDPQTRLLERGAALTALIGDSFFAASHALFLEDYLPDPSEHGTIVAIPHRHAILYHGITDGRVLVAIQSMIPIAFGMFQEGPGSVSPNLYWWKGGKYVLLPSRVTATAIQFNPPDEFVSLLEKLS